MRIKLKSGKQKELIFLAKRNLTWFALGNRLGISGDYLMRDLYNERRILDSKIYYRLCEISSLDYSHFIESVLDDNWGRSLGGLNSNGSTVFVNKPEKTEELAELIGIILGDGNLYWNETKGVYALKIAGDLKTEKQYIDFIKQLVDKIFGLNSKIEIKSSELFVSVYSREIIKRFEELGLVNGNKKTNNVGIPLWIKSDVHFLKACVRGLIDTDGSIFRMSRKDPELLRISFKNKAKNLLFDAHEALIRLGFHPSKINNDQFFISRKDEVANYIKYVRFNNPKHTCRIKDLAP